MFVSFSVTRSLSFHIRGKNIKGEYNITLIVYLGHVPLTCTIPPVRLLYNFMKTPTDILWLIGRVETGEV